MTTRGEISSMMTRQGAREPNQREVLLSFADSAEIRVTAIYDTGTGANWMSDSLSKRLGLQRSVVPKEIYRDVGNRPLESNISVRGYWHYGRQTHGVDFRILPDPPFVVVFGYTTLFQLGIVEIRGLGEEHQKTFLVLTKDNPHPDMKESQVNCDHARAEQERASQAVQGRKLQEAGWTWDPVQKQFWKNTISGTKQWYEGKL